MTTPTARHDLHTQSVLVAVEQVLNRGKAIDDALDTLHALGLPADRHTFLTAVEARQRRDFHTSEAARRDQLALAADVEFRRAVDLLSNPITTEATP